MGTSNIEHRTLNAEGARAEEPSAFDVQCSMFDVSPLPAGHLIYFRQSRAGVSPAQRARSASMGINPSFSFIESLRASEGQAGRLTYFI